jgi:glycosyltransferase involved in cell wall biosynthesis
MISVLLPSRKRPDSLRKSIASLRSLADQDIEILVAIDPDDIATIRQVKELGVKYLVTHERYGYHNLHIYYNQLAEIATGDWMLLWNDDAEMITRNWCSIITELRTPYLIADLQSELSSSGHCCFPAVRRSAIEAVGGFSPWTNHCDTFWQDIGRSTGKIKVVPVVVNHQRFDITGGHDDETYREGQQGYRPEHYRGSEVQSKIQECIKLIEELA